MAAGSVLCGFGKAKFRESDPKKPVNPDTEILFEVGCDSVGILDSKTATMEEFLNDATKSSKPNARVCYHKTTAQPDGTWTISKDGGSHTLLFLEG